MNDWSRALSADPAAASPASGITFSGNRGLQIEEKLIFEEGGSGRCGVDLPEPPPFRARLGGLERHGPIGLPGLSEPQVIRHFTRLSQKNYAIDSGLYPLGSCTMKHNPRLNEKLARLPGLADIHPLQPLSTVPGALELIDTLAHWLKTLTGMPAVALSPRRAKARLWRAVRHDDDPHSTRSPRRPAPAGAGARIGARHQSGDRSGLRVCRRCRPGQCARAGRPRRPRSKARPRRRGIDADQPQYLRPVRGRDRRDRRRGASRRRLFYCDGATFNAIVGRVRPSDLGIDCMHLNLHKTFSTPHGGGGPGSGPVMLAAGLAPYAPLPWVVHGEHGLELVEHKVGPAEAAIGRLKGFHGQIGMFVRALAYMMSHGADGLRQVAEDAVLNANYLRVLLKGELSLPFPGPCMHEVLFDDRFLQDSGVTTLDFVKALIDEGYHPMTMYFPLIVHGALLIEPTETESKATLDAFAAVVKSLSDAARGGDPARFRAAPMLAPRRRLDETAAARKPILRWRPDYAPSDTAEAD